MNDSKYWEIIRHYEDCLEKFGDSHLGVDWPNIDDADTRYKIMLDVVKDKGSLNNLLDFGCGASHLYDYIIKNNIKSIKYSGLDISEKFISFSEKKYPEINYYCVDIIKQPDVIPKFDYMILNGVFTEKNSLTYDEMLNYFFKLTYEVFRKSKIGIAFNVMSKHVDWERDNLFHLPFDTLASFLKKEITRNFIIRNDYGLYEYTVYVYKC